MAENIESTSRQSLCNLSSVFLKTISITLRRYIGTYISTNLTLPLRKILVFKMLEYLDIISLSFIFIIEYLNCDNLVYLHNYVNVD
jgi:hypothetical protein